MEDFLFRSNLRISFYFYFTDELQFSARLALPMWWLVGKM